jgi:hypothetical protein
MDVPSLALEKQPEFSACRRGRLVWCGITRLCRPSLSTMRSSNYGECCTTKKRVLVMQHCPQLPGGAAGRDGTDVRFMDPPRACRRVVNDGQDSQTHLILKCFLEPRRWDIHGGREEEARTASLIPKQAKRHAVLARKTRSCSVSPPHTPCTCRVTSANARHSERTQHSAQTAFARAACRSPRSDVEMGKNSSGSTVRQAASSRQSNSVARIRHRPSVINRIIAPAFCRSR